MGAPARAHVPPGAGRPSPAGASRANAAAPPEPGRRLCPPPAGGQGARSGPPSSAPPGFGQLPRPAGTWRGSPKKLCRPPPRLWRGGKVRGTRRKPRVPKARTRDSHGLRREGCAAGPCVRADAGSSLGTGQRPRPGALPPRRPSSSAARSARPPGKGDGSAPRPAAATSERAGARVRRASGACPGSLGGRPPAPRPVSGSGSGSVLGVAGLRAPVAVRRR